MNETPPEVSYCQLHMTLDGKKNAEGYTVQPEREQILYPQPEFRPFQLSVNWGPVKTETFGVYFKLRPEERPTPITGGARSKELHSVSCLRHAKEVRPMNVNDFLKAIGADKVDVTKTH